MHDTAPVAEISQEAVEAAAEAIHDVDDVTSGLEPNYYRMEARAALTAALPHLHPPAAPGPVPMTDEMVAAGYAAHGPAWEREYDTDQSVIRDVIKAALAAVPSSPAESDLDAFAAWFDYEQVSHTVDGESIIGLMDHRHNQYGEPITMAEAVAQFRSSKEAEHDRKTG